jgi:hypothetical protein
MPPDEGANARMRRLKITSDGDWRDCRVVDMETGEPVRHVVSVEWNAKHDDVPVARVTALMAGIDVETGAEVVRFCPGCERRFDEESGTWGPDVPSPGPGDWHGFNLNDEVRFKPTEKGMALYSEFYGGPVNWLKVDDEGRVTDQLWHVMQIFGPHISLGFKNPIETDFEIRRTR